MALQTRGVAWDIAISALNQRYSVVSLHLSLIRKDSRLGLGFAQGDVTRQQQAATQNVSNLMGNNQFNVNAGIQQRQLSDNEITSAQQNLAQSAGITQQVANNIVTANGINVDAATALFQSGQITQQQLNAITAAAQAANGTTFNANTGSSTNSNDVTASSKFGIG